MLDRSALAEHVNSVCDFRIVRCHYCTASMASNEMDNHLKSCLKYPIICPNECDNEGEILRENVSKSLEIP
jgi:hypothetical protein